MLISKTAVAEYLDRDFDSYTWMKKLSEATVRRELSAFRVPPKFKTTPWLHQLVCMYIGMCRPEFLFLLDMGLGKSKLILDLMTQVQREKNFVRGLVCVPRILNVDSWQEAARDHSDLEPWSCAVESIEEKWDRLMTPQGDFSLIDYQGLALALTAKAKVAGKKNKVLKRDDKKVRMLQKTYNFLALDECHKLKNHQSLWFGLVKQLRKEMDYCYGLTGTLFGRNLEEVWSQFHIVDRGETFGENLGLFRASFFDAEPDPWSGVKHVYKKSMGRTLHRMLQHRSVRYDEDEVQELPQRVPRSIQLDFDPEQREHYLRAVEGLLNAGGKLADMDAPFIRMRQIVSGYLAWKDEYGPHKVVWKENPKLEALMDIIDRAGRTKVVVCYDYTDTALLITERLKKEGYKFAWIYGGTKDKPAEKRKFMEDEDCKVLVMNSDAGGTGTDGLQKVARVMVFFESPTSPVTRQQTLKRIHRPGSTDRVFIYDLVIKNSIDLRVLKFIAEGKDLHEAVVGGKNVRLLA